MIPSSPRAADPLRRKAPPAGFDQAPFLAIWEVTQACDLACAHCRACATTGRDPEELTTAEGKRLLAQIAAMGTPLAVLTGGDPAKRPDLVELVEHGVHCGLTMAVTPSGTPLLTRDLVVQLKAAGLSRLAVSVDGADAATHDAFRGVAGSFAQSLRILRDAREIGLEVQVNTTAGPHNRGTIGAMADLVARVGAALWSVFLVVPTGRAGRSLLFGPAEIEQILGQLADVAASAPFDVKTTAAPHFRRVLLERRAGRGAIGVLSDVDEAGLVRGPRGINDGSGFVFVSNRGEIFPSGFLPLRAGDVRADNIADVYRRHPLFTALRDADALGGKCGVCPFRRVCGGSRARAFALTGDYLAEDPLCAYEPRGRPAARPAPEPARTAAGRSQP
ncbi:MAG: TIGR04053 family radical SAM/SPASM domain-containing protein [Deltaproteobacteria bacterium]|nr:TIGR04053 family radical SAM/SPASM domain-containing protein [Deltaproteobacteria bacterium]